MTKQLMKKSFLLLVVFLMLVIRGFSVSVTKADSLLQVLRQLPEKEKAAILPKAALDSYQTQATAAIHIAREYAKLPEKRVPMNRKIVLFKTLSEKFQQANDYKHALECLKIADSLQTAKAPPSATSRLSSSGYPVSFYLFAFVVLAAAVWLIYFYWITQKTAQALRLAKEKQAALKTQIATTEKEVEEKLQMQTQELQKELQYLHEKEASLKTSLKKATEASYLRNAFIANLGFDVRTPLNGIIGFANMLETELAVEANRELYDYAAYIEKSGIRLLQLLDNVIDLSALESNRLVLKIKPVALDKIVEKIFEAYLPQATAKGLIFKKKISADIPPVLADEAGLEKSLRQIVDNAIKYTSKGFVTMTSSYAEETDTDVIEIKDNGPGIPLEKQKNLFTDELPAENSGGTGIGLLLAHKYIGLMKGKMFLESMPGKGTTITLHLPCSEEAVIEEQPATEAIATEVSTASELGDLDIFVVEDDRMNRLILEKMLQPLGKVTLTVDGDDCMQTIEKEAAKGHFFQVMLFDINLPGEWDGVKLQKVIREKHPEYRRVPFIAQTAYAMAGDKEELLKEGFDSYLAKPIDKNELITTIKQQLSIYA
jgi:signal transduction histidine kinase/ActR/RegA family two-component response regulator